MRGVIEDKEGREGKWRIKKIVKIAGSRSYLYARGGRPGGEARLPVKRIFISGCGDI